MSHSDQSVIEMYVLGFAEFLAEILPPERYTVVDGPRHGADSNGARLTVRNAIGETFVLDIEHVRGNR